MNLLTRIGQWAREMAHALSDPTPGALDHARELDRVVREMTLELERARAEVRALPPSGEREHLERALRALEAKVSQAAVKRDELKQRKALADRRLETLRALRLEAEGLIAEGDALPGGIESDAPATRIRDRLTEIEREIDGIRRDHASARGRDSSPGTAPSKR
jgi:chromosome segregation ATPase